MTECIVCGEKIEDGQQYCSVCAPEHHEKNENAFISETPQIPKAEQNIEESKIEIRKDSIVSEDTENDEE